jgi:VWFA-related protein
MIKKSYWMLAIAAILLTAVASPAQEARKIEKLSDAPELPQFEQDVTVRLRLIDVTATDSSGKYMTDLTADDFTVYVNGKKVDIRTFDAYFPGAVEAPAQMDAAAAGVPNLAMPTRKIVLFMDQAYCSFRGLKNAKEAAEEFVTRNLSPGDEVMVVGYDMALRIYQAFTRDRDLMIKAIREVRYGFSNGPGDSAIFRGENPHNIRIYLQAMQKLALYLSSFRGRKTFVMMSEGFDERIALYSVPQYLKDTFESFNSSNSTIFTVDVRGIDAPGHSGSAMIDINRRRGRHNTLSTFAVDTGGAFYRGSNDIQSLLLNVDEDISHYYVLGFYVDEESDGRFREVKVETSRPGVKLRYRDGYFAPKPFTKLNSDERLVNLEEGFNLNSPASDMNADFGLQIYPRSDGSAVATVIIETPIAEGKPPEYEILGYVNSKDNKLVDAVHKIIEFTSMPSADRFRDVEPLNIEPGENLIRLVIRDNRSGKRAYQFLAARMPEMGEGFYASTISLLEADVDFATAASARVKSMKNNLGVPQQEAADPLASVGREGIIPGASQEMKRGERVSLLISVVGAKKDDRGSYQLAAGYKFRAADGTSYDAVERDFKVFPTAGGDAVLIVSTLDIKDVPPGDYTLNARIDDIAAKKAVGQTAQVVVR